MTFFESIQNLLKLIETFRDFLKKCKVLSLWKCKENIRNLKAPTLKNHRVYKIHLTTTTNRYDQVKNTRTYWPSENTRTTTLICFISHCYGYFCFEFLSSTSSTAIRDLKVRYQKFSKKTIWIIQVQVHYDELKYVLNN